VSAFPSLDGSDPALAEWATRSSVIEDKLCSPEPGHHILRTSELAPSASEWTAHLHSLRSQLRRRSSDLLKPALRAGGKRGKRLSPELGNWLTCSGGLGLSGLHGSEAETERSRVGAERQVADRDHALAVLKRGSPSGGHRAKKGDGPSPAHRFRKKAVATARQRPGRPRPGMRRCSERMMRNTHHFSSGNFAGQFRDSCSHYADQFRRSNFSDFSDANDA